MSLTTPYAPLEYEGNASARSFAVSWPFLDDDDLLVELVTAAGVTRTLILGSDYSVTWTEPAAGEVAYPQTGTVNYPLNADLDPLPAGDFVRIQRVTPRTQPTAFPLGGPFRPKLQESALDRLEMQIQEMAYKLEALTD